MLDNCRKQTSPYLISTSSAVHEARTSFIKEECALTTASTKKWLHSRATSTLALPASLYVRKRRGTIASRKCRKYECCHPGDVTQWRQDKTIKHRKCPYGRQLITIDPEARWYS